MSTREKSFIALMVMVMPVSVALASISEKADAQQVGFNSPQEENSVVLSSRGDDDDDNDTSGDDDDDDDNDNNHDSSGDDDDDDDNDTSGDDDDDDDNNSEDVEDIEDIEDTEDDSNDNADDDVSGGTDTTTVTTPVAGFEDEVLTVFDSNPFLDTDLTTLGGKAAAELYRRGVIGGFSDGEFKGDQAVNRAEAAKFLLLAKGITVQDLNNQGKFSDVLDAQWYTSYVMTAEDMGIISGYDDGTFKPGNTVNTAEFLKMLTLTFELSEGGLYSYTDVSADAWYQPYVGSAVSYSLFPEKTTELNPEDELTREEVAIAIYQYLSNR